MLSSSKINTQKQLIYDNLMEFYKKGDNIHKMMQVINGESKISLRIADWFVTNYSKKYFTVYEIPKIIDGEPSKTESERFKVYQDYKLKLRAYSKKHFDPFCRWERISIPYGNCFMETTIGQLNFFKWAIENKIVDYIQDNYTAIENDMNDRNSTAKRRSQNADQEIGKTRKKREELSISACKCIKKEDVKIVVKFH